VAGKPILRRRSSTRGRTGRDLRASRASYEAAAGHAVTRPADCSLVVRLCALQVWIVARRRLVRAHWLAELGACLVAALPLVLGAAKRLAGGLATAWADGWAGAHEGVVALRVGPWRRHHALWRAQPAVPRRDAGAASDGWARGWSPSRSCRWSALLAPGRHPGELGRFRVGAVRWPARRSACSQTRVSRRAAAACGC
jgi:hypothetical protein